MSAFVTRGGDISRRIHPFVGTVTTCGGVPPTTTAASFSSEKVLG